MSNAEARKAFPAILKSYMTRSNLNQSDVARALGVSKQAVSDWINGKKFPGVDTMQQLSDLFGVLMSDMYTPSQQTMPLKESPAVAPVFKLTDEEKRLVVLFRGAEKPARKIAMQTLENNQKKDTLSKAE